MPRSLRQSMASSECKSIGIDFGTTNTVVAVADAQKNVRVLELDPTSSQKNLLKSLLYFPKRNEAYFGNKAIEEYAERGMEGRFFQSIKRLLPNPEFTGTSLFGQHAGVDDLIARFLRETRTRIEKSLGHSIEGIPIAMGRPARYSNEPANEGLAVVRFKKAIEYAEFKNPIKLFEEPVAAAVVMQADTIKKEHAIVADLGGGTSDFSVYLEEPKTTPLPMAVHGISVAGDVLDSDFFIAKLNPLFGSQIEYQRPFSSNILTMPTSIVKSLPKWHHHAFLKERATWSFITTLRKELVDPKQKPFLENLITLVEDNCGYKLHQEVEKLKVNLSQKQKELFAFKSYPIDIEFDVATSDWNQMISTSIDAIEKTALESCRIARISADQIGVLRLTGGTSQVPAVRKRLSETFKNARVSDHNTFTAVAEGLALLGLKIL